MLKKSLHLKKNFGKSFNVLWARKLRILKENFQNGGQMSTCIKKFKKSLDKPLYFFHNKQQTLLTAQNFTSNDLHHKRTRITTKSKTPRFISPTTLPHWTFPHSMKFCSSIKIIIVIFLKVH